MVMAAVSVLVRWWVWWWCKTKWTMIRGSGSIKVNLNRGSESTSFVRRRWQLHLRKLARKGRWWAHKLRWWTPSSCQCWTKMGETATTRHLAPATIRKYCNVYVVSMFVDFLPSLIRVLILSLWLLVKTKHLHLHRVGDAACMYFVFD